MAQLPYLDSHLHLQDPRFIGSREAVLIRAGQSGVLRMFCNATREEDWREVLGLASDSVIPFIGIHPWYADTVDAGWEERLAALVEISYCGIGETGLDKRCSCALKQQLEVFTVQLRLAVAWRRPLAVHCLDCWGKLLEILEGQAQTAPLPPVMIHSFGGAAEVMHRLVRLGCWLSFSGRLATPGQERLRRVFRETPLHRILLETDAPDQLQADLVPAGRETAEIADCNEPAHIAGLYAFAANLYHMELQDFCRQIWKNGTVFTDSTLPR